MRINTNFKLEATPERVYTVLKLIELKPYNREELKALVHPIANVDGELNIVLNFLNECGWIAENEEKKYELRIDYDCLESISTFRQRVNAILFEGDQTSFFSYTSFVLNQSIEILGVKISDYPKRNPSLLQRGNKNFYLQWRLWAAFLGFGNLHKSHFIPNPAPRIKDILMYFNNNFERNKSYTLEDFFTFLIGKCPELQGCIQNNAISTFLSLALRTLHDEQVITLEYHQDFPVIWYLEKSELHSLANQVTHVKVEVK